MHRPDTTRARRSQAARLEFAGVERRASGRSLLTDIRLVILPGECVGLLGPSGSGKSTLLKTACGLTKPSSGQVLLDGQDLYSNRSAWRSRIGYVPQDDIIHQSLTVRRAIAYAARLRLPTLSATAVNSLVERVIGDVGLTERANLKIARLSGGQRKRASIAVELLARPSILFLDEPTSGQDPHLEENLMRLFNTLSRNDTTVLVTTHAMASVDSLDLVVLLKDGHIVFVGPPGDLKNFFETSSFEGVFKRLAAQPAGHWQRRFMTSTQFQTYVKARIS